VHGATLISLNPDNISCWTDAVGNGELGTGVIDRGELTCIQEESMHYAVRTAEAADDQAIWIDPGCNRESSARNVMDEN